MIDAENKTWMIQACILYCNLWLAKRLEEQNLKAKW
jgi:hypothetical protein